MSNKLVKIAEDSAKACMHANLGDALRIYLASSLSAIPPLILLQLTSFSAFHNLVFGGSLFVFTYLTLAPILGAIRTQDVENLKRIFGRLKLVWPIIKPILAYESKLISTLAITR